MKSLILALVTSFGMSAFAQQQITCIYQVGSDERGVKNVILNFNQNAYGEAAGGSIRIEHPDGRVRGVSIPGRDIVQLQAGPMYDAELGVNVHVRSYKVDLVLNYLGNELSHDVANHFGIRGRVRQSDLVDGYDQLQRMDALVHRNAMPMAQFSGTVRDEDGRLNKFASTQFHCSSSALNR